MKPRGRKNFHVVIERHDDGFLVMFFYGTDRRYEKVCQEIPALEIAKWVDPVD